MLRRELAIGLTVTTLGLGVLGASVYRWVQALDHAEGAYKWVRVDSSSAPAAETDEIWQVSAICERQYFVKAVLQAKAKLKAYDNLAPDEIRARRNGPIGPSIAEMEHDAALHVQYAEWYAIGSKLKEQTKQWEQRLIDIADQLIALSEVRRLIGIEQVSSRGDLERYALFLLGLGGFSSDQEKAIKQDCVSVIPVKKIVTKPNYYTQFWRWPVDQVAAFSIGLELVFVGVLFGPIAGWIRTGDSQTLWRHVRDTPKRLVTKAWPLQRGVFRAALSECRAFLTRL